MDTTLDRHRLAASRPRPLVREHGMDWRNRIGLYGSYFLGVSGIGFTLPYLPLYLKERGLSGLDIGVISTLAALAGLVQFPAGLWSDRLGGRKPFLVVALAVLAVATALLSRAEGLLWLGFLVLLFAENGACRATVESLAGAEATHLAPPGRVGAALGALRFWKPVGIILAALGGSLLAERYGVAAILVPLAVVQALAAVCALLIHEGPAAPGPGFPEVSGNCLAEQPAAGAWRDGALWLFLAAMVLFHVANAPGGVYLGLFMEQDLHAPRATLAYAFVVSMVAWMLVVWPAGRLADRLARRPLLILGWAVMSLRLTLVALARAPWQVVGIQVLDGVANGLFAVLAAAWVTDRLADPRRVGQAQVLVGSALVFGSALGPLLAGLLVGPLGYRALFGLLAAAGAAATLLLVALVPETLGRREGPGPRPMGTESDLATSP
jgi:MFS family permease